MKILITEEQFKILIEEENNNLSSYVHNNPYYDNLIHYIFELIRDGKKEEIGDKINSVVDRFEKKHPSEFSIKEIQDKILYKSNKYVNMIRDILYEKIINDKKYGNLSLKDLFKKHNSMGFKDLNYFIYKILNDEQRDVIINRFKIEKVRTDFTKTNKKIKEPLIKEPTPKNNKVFEKTSIDVNDYILHHKKDEINFGQTYNNINEFKNKIIGYGDRYTVKKNKNGEKIFNYKLNGIIDNIKKDGNSFIIEILIGTGGKIELKKNLTDTDNYYWTKLNSGNINRVMVTPYLFRNLRTL